MHGTRTSILSLLAIAAVSACDLTTVTECSCIPEPSVDVTSVGGEFLIRNRSEHELAVTVVVEGSLALIDGACERWEPRIAPGGTLRVPNDQVIGFFAAAETAVVSWCTVDGNQIIERGEVSARFS